MVRCPFGTVGPTRATHHKQGQGQTDIFHKIGFVADSSLAQSNFSDSSIIPITIFLSPPREPRCVDQKFHCRSKRHKAVPSMQRSSPFPSFALPCHWLYR